MSECIDGESIVFQQVTDSWKYEEIIDLQCAMTIASWWHSPASPNSTRLSTMGEVTPDMRLSDFASEAEYAAADPMNRRCLDALDRYIQDVQSCMHSANA